MSSNKQLPVYVSLEEAAQIMSLSTLRRIPTARW